METYIVQLLSGMVGTIGFALIFGVSKRLMLPVAIGGFASGAVYLLCAEVFHCGPLLSNVAAAAFCQIYAEVLARAMKTPTTGICIPAIIPLIPGSFLYYTMYAAVHRDWVSFQDYGTKTLQNTLGIAIGISFVSGILYIITNRARHRK